MTDAPNSNPATREALCFENLGVAYRVKGQQRQVLEGVSLTIAKGEAYGLVGESGCGKSTAAFAALRYLPRNGTVNKGRILIDGQDIGQLSGPDLRKLRQFSVSMVYQDPGRSLNPSLPVGVQVAEVFELAGVPRADWPAKVEDILARVQISDPRLVMQRYPHQLSGGMQQRVAIAMAIASNPTLLVLDEPTTGLDATVEAEVLDLIQHLRHELSTAILFISHNLAVIARMCDRVGVLYAGRLVEEARTDQIFATPRHPYTAGLLRCLPQAGRSKDKAMLATIPGFLPSPGSRITGCIFAPRCALADDTCRSQDPAFVRTDGRASKCHYPDRVGELQDLSSPPIASLADRSGTSILQVEALSKSFGRGAERQRVLRDVALHLRAGETLGLVGESGSGKTTLARCILGLLQPDTGSSIQFNGQSMAGTTSERTREQVKSIQIVFQNPDSALNRAHSVYRMLSRTIGLLVGLQGSARDMRVKEIASSVRLTERHLSAVPRQLSGGLKQRVAIARAFASDPKVLICDEPTSALDVSVQAAILNLLAELQATKGVSYILISHDLGVVRYLSDRIAVMYLGQMLETGPAEAVFSGPHHPYTAALLSSAPNLTGTPAGRVKLTGILPSSANLPTGCVFHTRCPHVIAGLCNKVIPPTIDLSTGHVLACHLRPDQLPQSARRDALASG
ncbi:MAG: ABC transporter ATP-binding protein [bacterium]